MQQSSNFPAKSSTDFINETSSVNQGIATTKGN